MDASFQLPTGLLTFITITGYRPVEEYLHNCEVTPYSIFYPDFHHPELITTVGKLEQDKLNFPSDLNRLICSYSLDTFQVMCRFVEWIRINTGY